MYTDKNKKGSFHDLFKIDLWYSDVKTPSKLNARLQLFYNMKEEMMNICLYKIKISHNLILISVKHIRDLY